MPHSPIGDRSWSSELPSKPGVYALWDPTHDVHILVRVGRLGCGHLAVQRPRRPGAWIPVRCWKAPCARSARWRGPLEVPAALEEGDCVPRGVVSPQEAAHGALDSEPGPRQSGPRG